MQAPIDLSIATVVNLVAGASPAYATVTIVAAPGAGSRLRIWACGISAITAVAAAGLWHVYWRPSDDSFRVPASAAREAGSAELLFPGGVALPDNAAWEVMASITGAGSRTMPAWAAYTVELTP